MIHFIELSVFANLGAVYHMEADFLTSRDLLSAIWFVKSSFNVFTWFITPSRPPHEQSLKWYNFSWDNYFYDFNSFLRIPMASEEELSEIEDHCAICWEGLETARKLPCGHFFHQYVYTVYFVLWNFDIFKKLQIMRVYSTVY